VGRFEGRNEPTVITTTRNGVLEMDQVPWIPEWSLPPPDEIRFGDISSIFSTLSALPWGRMVVTLEVIEARSRIHLTQLPAADNSFTTVLEFDDNKPWGSAYYRARLTFEFLPGDSDDDTATSVQVWGWACPPGDQCPSYIKRKLTTDPTGTLEREAQIGVNNGYNYGPHQHVYARSWAEASLGALKTFTEFDLEYLPVGSYTTPILITVANASAVNKMTIYSNSGAQYAYFLPGYLLHGTLYQGAPDRALPGTTASVCAAWGIQAGLPPFECHNTNGEAFRFINMIVQARPHPLTAVPLNQPFLWYTFLQTDNFLLYEPTGLQLDGRYFAVSQSDFSATLRFVSVAVVDENLQPIRDARIEVEGGLVIPLEGIPVPTPFESFIVEKARVWLPPATDASRFSIWGTFVLEAASDGIDILNEDVTVVFHDFHQTIPAGAFSYKPRRGMHRFNDKGTSAGIRQLDFYDDGRFHVWATLVDLSGIDLSTPVPFSIQIGNDRGDLTIQFDRHGRFGEE
jgi:hypothetical protein